MKMIADQLLLDTFTSAIEKMSKKSQRTAIAISERKKETQDRLAEYTLRQRALEESDITGMRTTQLIYNLKSLGEIIILLYKRLNNTLRDKEELTENEHVSLTSVLFIISKYHGQIELAFYGDGNVPHKFLSHRYVWEQVRELCIAYYDRHSNVWQKLFEAEDVEMLRYLRTALDKGPKESN